jgi:hypothetical protein
VWLTISNPPENTITRERLFCIGPFQCTLPGEPVLLTCFKPTAPVFAKLKKFLFGDTRPIRRSIAHPALGDLIYSDDAEAWLTDPKSSRCGFGFYIAGDWSTPGPEVLPPQQLIDTAIDITSHSEAFVRSVRDLIESKMKTMHSRDPDFEEIKKLQVYRVALMWPERPNDGEIELRTSPDSNRMWHCGYIDRKPIPALGFSGLDD